MTKICTIPVVMIFLSLQRSIFQFMKLHTKPQVTMTLKFLLQQRWVNKVHIRKGCNWKGISYLTYKVLIWKDHWILIKYFILKIIEKTVYRHMRQTQCHIQSLGRRDNMIYLHDLLIGSMESGLIKLLNTTMQPEEWFIIISWNRGYQKRFVIITQVDT